MGQGNAPESEVARRVIVSAGSLGSTELLLRCRDVFRSLPRIGPMLGRNFSANGDFLGFVVGTKPPADPNYGPIITQATDFNLLNDFAREHAFVLEDASYPALAAWFVEGAKPGFLYLGPIWRLLRDWRARMKGRTTGPLGFALADLLSGDSSYHTAVLLFMGVDRSNGTMTLGSDGFLDLDWPTADSAPLYDAMLRAGDDFRRQTDADHFFALPTWWWPLRKNVSVHALGGCVVGDDPTSGVTAAEPDKFGQVHGYEKLYVADGSILPNAVGANPTATISALSEMVAQSITGVAPTANL
jgi:cholesterol oxidase